MAIQTVIFRGFGSFGGGVNKLPSRGYGSAAFVASISVTLTDVLNVAIPGLTGLIWAWWDSPVVSSQVAPAAQGTGATTDAAGAFSITTLPGSALTVGQTGWLEVTDSDGTVGQSPIGKVAAGPIVVN